MRWKWSSFCDVFNWTCCDFGEGIYLIFRKFIPFDLQDPFTLVFVTWVMKRTVVANTNPKIIHFDAVDFSGHHSKKL